MSSNKEDKSTLDKIRLQRHQPSTNSCEMFRGLRFNHKYSQPLNHLEFYNKKTSSEDLSNVSKNDYANMSHNYANTNHNYVNNSNNISNNYANTSNNYGIHFPNKNSEENVTTNFLDSSSINNHQNSASYIYVSKSQNKDYLTQTNKLQDSIKNIHSDIQNKSVSHFKKEHFISPINSTGFKYDVDVDRDSFIQTHKNNSNSDTLKSSNKNSWNHESINQDNKNSLNNDSFDHLNNNIVRNGFINHFNNLNLNDISSNYPDKSLFNKRQQSPISTGYTVENSKHNLTTNYEQKKLISKMQAVPNEKNDIGKTKNISANGVYKNNGFLTSQQITKEKLKADNFLFYIDSTAENVKKNQAEKFSKSQTIKNNNQLTLFLTKNETKKVHFDKK
ncbi:homeobox protein 2 [Hydra vulgaris]|uniref:homeobox protein 2 n=1 Tax=Hydra vulgaris TaxID=6087 RepID=UPI001F5EDFF7|nr:homeobox protein 2-like [Hydra vulgaris]